MVAISNKLVIFGGYGGPGAHRRLNDVLICDPCLGTLREVLIEGATRSLTWHVLKAYRSSPFPCLQVLCQSFE